MFSGDLNKRIISSPVFNGQEKHLLKCVLSKIDHACELTINGIYKIK